jgi:hypothetical protein
MCILSIFNLLQQNNLENNLLTVILISEDRQLYKYVSSYCNTKQYMTKQIHNWFSQSGYFHVV